MESIQLTMAEQVAQAARDFQYQRTGFAPTEVTAVLSKDTLVLTLHETLTPAERALSRSPEGAEKVRRFHQELFADSAEVFRGEIKRITGVGVRETAAEVDTTTGVVVQIFNSGTMVQVFQLANGIDADVWNGLARQP